MSQSIAQFNKVVNEFFGSAFTLRFLIGILVPSTKGSVPLSDVEFEEWTLFIRRQLAHIFGASSQAAVGAGEWEGIEEAHTMVYAYTDNLDRDKARDLQGLVNYLQTGLDQQCIAVITETASTMRLYDQAEQANREELAAARLQKQFAKFKDDLDKLQTRVQASHTEVREMRERHNI